MTIDFAGVVRMADAIGGVEVCVEQNVWDRPLPGVPGGSGLKMKAGTHKVQGKQALQWLRTRHAWGSDPLRARAQHMYMNSMIRTLKGQNVFTDTGRLMDLAEAATKSLKVSEEIGTVKKLYDLGMQLKSVPTDRITMTTMPTVEDPKNPNHLVPDRRRRRQDVGDAPRRRALRRQGREAGREEAEEGRAAAPRTRAAADGEIGVLVQNAHARPPRSARWADARGTIAEELVRKGFTQAAEDATAALVRGPDRRALPERRPGGRRPARRQVPGNSREFGEEVDGCLRGHGRRGRRLAYGTAYPKQSGPRPVTCRATRTPSTARTPVSAWTCTRPYRW